MRPGVGLSSGGGRTGIVGKDLSHRDTFSVSSLQWDPEDVNLERNKDNVEFVSSQMHGGSLTPADLTSDD